MATVRDGESIPLTKNRFYDAGFDNLIITPMGADKVFFIN